MEQQCTDALSREQSARNWANYVEAGARQIALEVVGHARVRDADFYYQLVKLVSRLEAEASRTTSAWKGTTRTSNAPYRTSGKSEARRTMPVPAFSVYHRWRPSLSS